MLVFYDSSLRIVILGSKISLLLHMKNTILTHTKIFCEKIVLIRKNLKKKNPNCQIFTTSFSM
jgi:hypothetical protein